MDIVVRLLWVVRVVWLVRVVRLLRVVKGGYFFFGLSKSYLDARVKFGQST